MVSKTESSISHGFNSFENYLEELSQEMAKIAFHCLSTFKNKQIELSEGKRPK